MICPECGVEYEDGIRMCQGCEVLLVHGSGEGGDEDEVEEIEFTALVESTDVTYFGLVTTRLEEAGIPWFVQGETSLGVLPRDGGDLGREGVEVATIYVAEDRFDKARQLARELDAVGVRGVRTRR